MEVPRQFRGVARFAAFELDLQAGELKKQGVKLRLPEQSFQILAMLLERPGEVVTREELRKKLWPADTFVDFDVGLNNAVLRLRNVLGDSAESPRFVETLPRRGYRFIARVDRGDGRDVEAGLVSAPRGHPQGVPLPKPLASSRSVALAAAGVVLAGALLAGWFYWRHVGSGNAIDSVAVLPFTNGNADPNMEYLSDGITESLINSLSQLPKLRVVAFNTAFRYKGQRPDPQQVGRDLNVRAVVMGRVLQPGEGLTITTELVDVANGSHLWGEQYNRKFRDILAVQEEIAKEIAEKLRLSLTRAERQRLAKGDTDNPAAYREYLIGRHFWVQRTPAALKQGLEHFEKAIELDPNYALAHAGVADSYLSFAQYDVISGKEAYPKARAAAIKALQLNPTLSEGYSVLAVVSLCHDWDWVAAERAFQRAIALKPNNPRAHLRYAVALAWFERFDEALREIGLAREADPVWPLTIVNMGQILYWARRYDQAVEQHRKALEFDPNFWLAHHNLGLALVSTHAYDEAIVEFKKAIDLGKSSMTKANLAHAYAVSGQPREARKILDDLESHAQQTYVSPFDLAVAYVGLGDRDRAFAWLEKAYDERPRLMLSLKVNPRLDPLRSDRRFAALLRRMKVFDTN